MFSGREARETSADWRGPALLEPHVGHAAAVARQVIEAVEAVEVVDDDRGDGRRILGESQIDGDAALALVVQLEAAPIGDAAAVRAEVEAKGLAANVGLGRAGDVDALAFVVVGPERAVATAGGAVAGGGGLRRAVKGPVDGAAETKPLSMGVPLASLRRPNLRPA